MKIETLHQLYLWARNQVKDGWFNAKIINSKDISDPIVKAIEKQVKIDVPDIKIPDIKIPDIKIPDIKIPDFKEISSRLRDLINKKEKDVVIKKITINNRELLDVLERIESKAPQEQLDFTPILNEIYNLIDGKSSDFSVFLNNFPIEDDRVKVSLSEEQLKKLGGKVSGGRYMSSENVKDSNGNRINPATSEKQDSLLTELQKKADLTETQPVSVDSLPLPSGSATESKQDDIITAINRISGGTTYNYIQSAENESGYNYDGFASSSGWKIMRETVATGKMQYAQGTGDYDTAWAARAEQTYGN